VFIKLIKICKTILIFLLISSFLIYINYLILLYKNSIFVIFSFLILICSEFVLFTWVSIDNENNFLYLIILCNLNLFWLLSFNRGFSNSATPFCCDAKPVENNESVKWQITK